MSLWSKQFLFCNICGKEFEIEIPRSLGKNCKVCTIECLEEYKWRETLSIMGKSYKLHDPITRSWAETEDTLCFTLLK
jgi:hypothetical protein